MNEIRTGNEWLCLKDNDQINEDEMDRVCSTQGREEEGNEQFGGLN
jgi:hypothetical protein